jgi:hypothetical protein
LKTLDDIIAHYKSDLSELDASDEYVVFWDRFWGKGGPEVPVGGHYKGVELQRLRGTDNRLFVFKQYIYARERIETRLSVCKAAEQGTSQPPTIVLAGTPGVGALCSQLGWCEVNNSMSSGKSTFLHFMAIGMLKKKQPFASLVGDAIYFFSSHGVHRMRTNRRVSRFASRLTKGKVVQDTILLTDLDGSNLVTTETSLFLQRCDYCIIQAASPNPEHIKWIKQSGRSKVTFVMNPHGDDEIFDACVFNRERFFFFTFTHF